MSERPSILDCGVQLPSGRVRCRYRGCRRLCASWFGLLIHLKRGHGVSLDDISWGDLFES